jgi:hypothetical protein
MVFFHHSNLLLRSARCPRRSRGIRTVRIRIFASFYFVSRLPLRTRASAARLQHTLPHVVPPHAQVGSGSPLVFFVAASVSLLHLAVDQLRRFPSSTPPPPPQASASVGLAPSSAYRPAYPTPNQRILLLPPSSPPSMIACAPTSVACSTPALRYSPSTPRLPATCSLSSLAFPLARASATSRASKHPTSYLLAFQTALPKDPALASPQHVRAPLCSVSRPSRPANGFGRGLATAASSLDGILILLDVAPPPCIMENGSNRIYL